MLLTGFLLFWGYSEWNEWRDRYSHAKKDNEMFSRVYEFMDRGGRFTKEDGLHLQSLIDDANENMSHHLSHSTTFTDMIINNERRISQIERDISLLQHQSKRTNQPKPEED